MGKYISFCLLGLEKRNELEIGFRRSIFMSTQHTTINKHKELNMISKEGKMEHSAHIIAITSGKGGVGKTNVSTNLGIALSGLQKKVCVLDADMGLANINILVGLKPDYTIEDILSGEKEVDQVLVDGPGGIKIVPASSGLEKIVTLGPQKKERLISAFEEMEKGFDYILIDTSAGVSPTVLSFVQSAQDAIIVVSPEPTSLTDAYALVKTLKGKKFNGKIFILVNMVLSYEDSVKIFNRFNAATRKYLSLDTKYLGHVILDQGLVASVIQQKPIVVLKPESVSSKCFVSIARKFESIFPTHAAPCFSKFWKKIASDRVVENGKKTITPSKDVRNKFSTREMGDGKKVITPPKDVREKFSKINELSLEELANKASQIIEKGTCIEDEAREFIQKIEYSFTKKFDKLSYDLKTAIYSSLEFTNFSEESIKELNQFLESLYEKRFKHSLHNMSDLFFTLLEESTVSEEKMKNLMQLIENSFRRQFKKSVYNLKQILTEELSGNDYDENGFSELIETIEGIYQNRFGRAYKEPLLFPVAETKKIINKLKSQEREFEKLVKKASRLSKEKEVNYNQLIDIISDFSKKMQPLLTISKENPL